jgi:protein gp37
MVTCPQHTFVLLTKRPQNMMKAVLAYGAPWDANILWPRLFPNVWLGVTVENQERADERVPILLNTPAAHRWLSAEPLLGPIDLLRMCREQVGNPRSAANHGALEKLDLVICGGESGRNARLMRPGWPKYLKYQCDASGVRFHFKQYGDNYLKGDYQAGSSQVFEGVDYSVLKPEAIWKVTA